LPKKRPCGIHVPITNPPSENAYEWNDNPTFSLSRMLSSPLLSKVVVMEEEEKEEKEDWCSPTHMLDYKISWTDDRGR